MENDNLPSVEKTHRVILGGFAVVGLFSLLAILTIEWFNYFEPLAGGVPVLRSITLFWTLYALFWLVLGFSACSLPVRVCGLIVLFTALAKTTLFDSTVTFGYCSWNWNAEWSLADWRPLANPYFLTMLCPAIPAMVFAVWVNRRQKPMVGKKECSAWKTAGVFGILALLVYLSVECFQYFSALEESTNVKTFSMLARASLTIFWTLVALLLTLLARSFASKILRIGSMLLLGLAVSKVMSIDLPFRPDYLVPFLNPYSLPMLFLAMSVIVLGFFWAKPLETENAWERNVYRFITFFGVFFLWLLLSVECFRSVKLQTANLEAWKAQMALSILWSLFAGMLITVGFLGKSPVLRWMAICLFAITLLKVLAVDMSGVNELYRFGAVFVLALLLSFAAWAYQRFKPET